MTFSFIVPSACWALCGPLRVSHVRFTVTDARSKGKSTLDGARRCLPSSTPLTFVFHALIYSFVSKEPIYSFVIQIREGRG